MGNGFSVNCNPIPFLSFLPSFPPTETGAHTHMHTPRPLVPTGAEQTPGPCLAALPHNQHLSSHLHPCLPEGSAPHPHVPTAIRLSCWTSCFWRAMYLNHWRDDKPGGGRWLFPLQSSDKVWLIDLEGLTGSAEFWSARYIAADCRREQNWCPSSVNPEMATGSLELHQLRHHSPPLISLKLPLELKAVSLHWSLISALWLLSFLNPLSGTGTRGIGAERLSGGILRQSWVRSFWLGDNSQPWAAASTKNYCPGEDTSSLSILDLPMSFGKICFSSSCPIQCFKLGSALPFLQRRGKLLPFQGEAGSNALFSGCKGGGEVNLWRSWHKLLCPFLVLPLFDTSCFRPLCHLAAGKSLTWTQKSKIGVWSMRSWTR